MSRIGVQPIAVPSGVEVKIQPGNVEVKGPKGELSQAYDPDITIEQDGDVLTVKRPTDSKDHKSKHGLVRALLANMVNNCANGYSKELEIQGVGYRAAMKGKNIELSVGYSHPVLIEPPDGRHDRVPAADTGDRLRRRQAGRGRDRRTHPQDASAGAVQGQGHSLQGRARPEEGW